LQYKKERDGFCPICENVVLESTSPIPGYEMTDCHAENIPPLIMKQFEDGEPIINCPCFNPMTPETRKRLAENIGYAIPYNAFADTEQGAE